MVMTKTSESKYKHRCELNEECYIILKHFGRLKYYDTLVIYSKIESIADQAQSEWLGFVTTIKSFILKQNSGMQRYVQNQVQSLNSGMTSKMESMQNQMKDVKNKLTDLDTNFDLRVKSV